MSYSLWPHGLQPIRLLCPSNFPGNNTAVGCHFLLQRIFQTQGSNWCLLNLLHWQADSLHCTRWEAPFLHYTPLNPIPKLLSWEPYYLALIPTEDALWSVPSTVLPSQGNNFTLTMSQSIKYIFYWHVTPIYKEREKWNNFTKEYLSLLYEKHYNVFDSILISF